MKNILNDFDTICWKRPLNRALICNSSKLNFLQNLWLTFLRYVMCRLVHATWITFFLGYDFSTTISVTVWTESKLRQLDFAKRITTIIILLGIYYFCDLLESIQYSNRFELKKKKTTTHTNRQNHQTKINVCNFTTVILII